MPASEKRKLFYQFALDNIEILNKQFAQFGLLIQLFVEMIKKALIYQVFKPVYWSWSSQAALAEAEIEYKDLISPSIYVKFNVMMEKIFDK